MEMRTVLKFLQILLDDGLREAVNEGGSSSIDPFVDNVNLVFNQTIFGTILQLC